MMAGHVMQAMAVTMRCAMPIICGSYALLLNAISNPGQTR